jgi:hypothetical protein
MIIDSGNAKMILVLEDKFQRPACVLCGFDSVFQAVGVESGAVEGEDLTCPCSKTVNYRG